MKVQDIIGNKHLIDTLFGSIAAEKPCGCYIIAGPEGTGKLTLARLAAASLNCHNRTHEGYPCTECNSCKKILSGGHVDVPEIGLVEGRKQVSVEQVRNLLELNSFVASEAERKVFILREASALNANGQNALLKSLEEPGDTVFFLLTDNLGALLPTVRSRSFILHTELLPDSEIIKKLKEIYPDNSAEEIRKKAHFSYGSLGRALGDTDKGYFKNIDRVHEYFTAISQGARHAVLCSILPPARMTGDDLRTVIPLLCEALRDILVFLETDGAEPTSGYAFFDGEETLLKKTAYIIGKKKAATLSAKLAEISDALDYNMNAAATVSRINILFS